MANFMYILRPTTKKVKEVCSECYRRGEVVDSCTTCHGSAIKRRSFQQFYVQDKPIRIENIDRDPKTGVLRYWQNSSEFYYETTTPKLNRYMPEIPYGIHLCHDDRESAEIECERINKYLLSNKIDVTLDEDNITATSIVVHSTGFHF